MDISNKVAWITGGRGWGSPWPGFFHRKGAGLRSPIGNPERRLKKRRESSPQRRRSDHVALRFDEEGADRAGRPQNGSTFGSLDILVNLSSMYEKDGWDEHMKSNAESAYLLTQAVAPWMKPSGGRIVHIADWTSASGRPRYKGYSPYYVSKAAIKGVVESMALELAPRF